jgi:U3 small nucleolar RNA-associated protein 6
LRTSNSSPEVSRVLARALTLHPTNPAIWLLAIRFEADGTASYARDEINTFEDDQPESTIGGGNIDAARKLAMRGIRFTKGAREEDARILWVEWARLEISFVERMRKRWEILGIKDAMNGQANLDVEGMQVDGAPAEDSVEQAEKQLEAVQESQGRNAVLEGGIAKIVIQNALAAFPGKAAIYADMLRLLRPLPTPLRPTLLEEIYTSLRSNMDTFEGYTQAGQARILLARRHLADLAEPQKDGLSLKEIPVDSVEWTVAVGNAVHDYRAGLAALSGGSEELVGDFADFLADCWQKTEDSSLASRDTYTLLDIQLIL